MTELSDKIVNLEISDDIFKDIKYFITGEVHEKIENLLKLGGAEHQNYFSDYVTHLIVGNNPEENDIADAEDVYEIPAVTPKWIIICASLKRRVDPKPYLFSKGFKLFMGQTFCFSRLSEDKNNLWGIITYHGGKVHTRLTRMCNILVSGVTDSPKYVKAESLGPDVIKIVTPDWVIEALKTNSLPDPSLFHPKLINWPPPPKPHEPTTAITGFEPDNSEAELPQEDKALPDSTQALLEKLKQRMPWNQPVVSTSAPASDPVAPPNVVAPSFLSKMQSNQGVRPLGGMQATSPVAPSFSQAGGQSPNHIPRSVVHHTPNSSQQQLIGQAPQGVRPNLQQLRGQLNTSQIHQQLLQHRMQQQQQNQKNLLQRTPTGQINQQLLHQQLSQGQRQVLQNQLMNPQGLQQQQQQQQAQSQLMGQQTHANQQQFNQQQLLGQQNQQPSNQSHVVPSSPQQNQNPLMSPQHLQNQLISHQQQAPVNQQLLPHQQQNQNQFLNQQQPQNQLQSQLLGQQSPQSLMSPNQLIQQNQPSQQLIQQNQQLLQQQNQQQLIQQNQQMIQQNQQPQASQSQLINQQNQHLMNQQQSNQQNLLNLPPNHHLGQLSPQQIQQLQQLKREQQQLLNSTQQQIGGINQQSIGLNQQNLNINQHNLGLNQQQNIVNQGQNQQMMPPNQQMQMNQQQLIQNRGLQQHQQSFGQQGLGQHLLNQKQQLFQQQQQQQINTGQHQQLIQNQQNVTNQQQFVNQSQGQINPTSIGQMNVQTLNQQLNSQNLGQQLNQQLLQQNQQSQQLGQPSQQSLGMEQNLGLINQQQPPVLGQQPALNQQVNPAMNQQVIRGQFPQQVLVNQQGQQRSQQLNQQMWAQQQQQGATIQGQQIVRHPVAVQQSPTGAGPRIQWPPGQQPGMPQRQYIQLDAHTHNQLQKMPPDQQALFVAKLQRQRQLQLAKQVQRGGGHILIRGNVPPGLTAQQQVQWLQQQAKQQGIVFPPNIQQNLTPASQPAAPVAPPHTPGLSPINQNAGSAQPFVGDQPTQQQLQLRQFRLQQLQMQREQAQKSNLPPPPPGNLPGQAVVRPPLGQPPTADSTTNPQVQVNPKTKTALANMLSIKLQSGGTIGAPVRPEGIPEPSAAGTLRMMTAQHIAATNSKPQEIIALQQRRVISGPNGEIIKPPGVPALPLTPQNDPPKLQFNQKPPVPVQHRVGPFYGHNPNLKLPPDLFLLGCIFVVVEVEDYLEEKIPGWQQKIEQYGGEVEKQYCSKVTHVLCETQRHGVVMQALRDLKRCVTIRWLSDVIKRKQVVPPWTALHLPQIYLDITPASKHLISISGFEGNTRLVIKQMIQYTGAKCTSYFSKHNTLLICAKAEGKKYNKAKKWGIPVVNVQWLTDVILGNFSAMHQMDSQVYQTYSNPPNLSFDPKLVPNIMHAWKAPINISQESYERVKRSASPVILPKAKRQKTEQTDENENITEEMVNPNYKILFSQFTGARVKELEKIVRDLGGTVTKDQKDFTHLVLPKLTRTAKLFYAVVKSAHILPEKWLEDSSTSLRFLPESNYTSPTEEFNKNFNCTLEKTLLTTNRDKLLEGKAFWVTPSVFPNKRTVCDLIEMSGGQVERVRRTRLQVESTNSTTSGGYFILTATEDLHLVADLLKNKKEKQKVVCCVELVLSAVLRQEFDVEPYVVSVV